jgi:hypothetical protein
MAVALSITLAACTNGSSSKPAATTQPPKGVGTVSLVVSGKVVAHYARGCTVGSDSIPNQQTVVFPSVGKVSDNPLTLVVYAPKSSASATYPASSTAAAVRLSTATGSAYSWANSSGTLTVSPGGTAGTLDLTLAPTPISSSTPANQADGTVHVQGSWTGCAST